MVRRAGAESFVPPTTSLAKLKAASSTCEGCPLYRGATQTVFGEGRPGSSLMLVGEQPGNDEDLAGAPFVGPAGRVLDEALDDVGIARDDVYVTNAVKHFKFERRGKLRLHKKPSVTEVQACRPWLHAEIAAVRPALVVCLGATAAQSLLGSAFRVTREHGQVRTGADDMPIMATVHPSSVLRAPDPEARVAQYELLRSDLESARGFLDTLRQREGTERPPPGAAVARRKRTGGTEPKTRQELYEEARRRNVPGRSRMGRAELLRAVRRAR